MKAFKNAKLTPDDVELVRELACYRAKLNKERTNLKKRINDIHTELKGLSNTKIGEKFDVTKHTIQQAVTYNSHLNNIPSRGE